VTAHKAALALALTIALLILLAAQAASTNAQAAQYQNAFQVVNAGWGSQSSPQFPTPGESDVPLTIDLLSLVGYTAQDLVVTLSLPAGFTSTQGSQSVSSTLSQVGGYQSATVTFFLDLSPTLKPGTYSLPLTLTWHTNTNNTSQNYYEDAAATVSIQGSVQLVFHTLTPSLAAGRENPLNISILNYGSGSAYDLQVQITTQSQYASVVTQPAPISYLGSNQSTTVGAIVYVSPSAQNLPLAIDVEATYTNAYGYQGSAQALLGVSVLPPEPLPFYVSVDGSMIPLGGVSNLSIVLTNTGNQSVYSPTLSITAPPTLLVLSNSTYYADGLTLPPSQSLTYRVSLGSEPNAYQGAYQVEVGVSYYTPSGLLISGNLPVAVEVYSPLSPLVVQEDNVDVWVGSVSNITFSVVNRGQQPVYNVEYTISLPSSSGLAALTTTGSVADELAPNQSASLNVEVAAGPSVGEGAYTAQLSLTYQEESGETATQLFEPGFIVVGRVNMIVQGLQVATTPGSLTVTGTLINEGNANANYLYVYATLYTQQGVMSNTSTYVGQVAADSPTPFSLTLNYTGHPTKAVLGVSLSYINDYGQAFIVSQPNTSVDLPPTFTPPTVATESGSTPSVIGPLLILVIVGVAVVVLVIYVRRARTSG
jgi:hypothetical protein